MWTKKMTVTWVNIQLTWLDVYFLGHLDSRTDVKEPHDSGTGSQRKHVLPSNQQYPWSEDAYKCNRQQREILFETKQFPRCKLIPNVFHCKTKLIPYLNFSRISQWLLHLRPWGLFQIRKLYKWLAQMIMSWPHLLPLLKNVWKPTSLLKNKP